MRLHLDTSVCSDYYDERASERMELTIEELNEARLELKQKLLTLTQNFEIVKITKQVKELARKYVAEGVVPSRYLTDAIHIAAAVIAKADILVSWNYRHLVKRSTRLLVNYINNKLGLRFIEILAPPEI